MAVTDPVRIAVWVIEAGWTSNRDRTKAVAVAVASGSDPSKPAGLFGVGGPAGDGPGQADHAYSVWNTQGWQAFPVARAGTDVLVMPIAAAAVATAVAGGAVAKSAPFQAAADVVDKATAPARAAGDLAQAASGWMSYFSTENAWLRVVKFGLGVSMIVIAAARITSSTVLSPLVDKVGSAANTIVAGRIVKSSAKSSAQSAANTVRRSSYKGRHTAEGAPIRDASATEVVDNKR